jgi:hypothetical protein
VFPVRYGLNLYVLVRINPVFKSRVEARSNTSTVALRVVGGDEKETRCQGVQLGHPVRRGYKYVDWPSRFGSLESVRVKCGYESHGTRT